MDIASALLAYLETSQTTSTASDRHEMGKLLASATDAERGSVLELIAAAALDDGTLSESEQALLDRHDGSGPGGEVRRALDVVRAAMPFASDADRRRFLAQRADVIRSAAERERVLGACVDVLTAAGAPNLEARCLIFTSALGLSDAALARVRAS